jgi:hypothetical protein
MRLTDLPGSEAKSASFREKRAPSSCISCGVATLAARAGGTGVTVRIRVPLWGASRLRFGVAFPSTHTAPL